MNRMKDTEVLSRIEKLFVFLVIISSGTTISLTFSLQYYAMVLLFAVFILLRRFSVNYNMKVVVVCFVSVSFLFLQYAFAEIGTLSASTIMKNAALFLSVILFVSYNPHRNTSRFDYFIKLLLVISAVSNVLFVLYLIGIPLPTVGVHNNDANIVSIMYLEQITISGNYGVFGYRNSGIYWEPGMYQIYLNLMLIYYLYAPKDRHKNRALICAYLILTIITTGSVTGYAVCMLIMVLYAMWNFSKPQTKILIIVLTAIGVIVAYPYLEAMLNTKMTIGNSFEHRFSDIVNGLELFKKSPIWGFGLENNVYAQEYAHVFNEARGNTNGLIAVLLQFGTIGLVFYLAQFKNFCAWLRENYDVKMILPLVVWLFASFNNEQIALHPFVYFLLGIGIGQKSRKKRFLVNHE